MPSPTHNHDNHQPINFLQVQQHALTGRSKHATVWTYRHDRFAAPKPTNKATKKGEPLGAPLFCLRAEFNLERVTPVEHHIDPIGAFANPAISRAKVTYFITLANVVSRLTDAVAHV